MTADNYKKADGKPKAQVIGYNTVRSPELKLIYNKINDSPSDTTNISTLKKSFVSDDDGHLYECIKFLHTLDLIEKPDERVVRQINQDVFPELGFEAKLLHHLKQQGHPQDHLARTQDAAFEKSPKTVDREQLVTTLNRKVEYIEWNKTKVNMWYRLYDGIGVINYMDSREIILSPSRALLYELLDTFKRIKNSNDFGEAVVWIEQNFMTVLTDRPGTAQLHRGVTDTLQNLMDNDIIEVRGMADAQNEIKLPSTHSRTETPAVKEFSLSDLGTPRDDSNRYPLNRFQEAAQ